MPSTHVFLRYARAHMFLQTVRFENADFAAFNPKNCRRLTFVFHENGRYPTKLVQMPDLKYEILDESEELLFLRYKWA